MLSIIQRGLFSNGIRLIQQSIRNKYRNAGNLKTMKIETPEFKKIFTPELTVLVNLFEKHNYELRIAGGAVRDLLLGKMPHDIDFATTATPEEMKELFTKEEVRMINTKGEKHGTITARINDKENFEVTTLRIDVTTDGRHAEVQFTQDWKLDANRRDLTVNAMFLGFDGTLFDYFDGKSDLLQRKIRFVGNAAERIQEDYLRILRYFRFFGRLVTNPNDHDQETLDAIKDNASGLAGISGERIWVELKKIITGNHASSIMDVIVQLGISQYLGISVKPNLSEFKKVHENCEGLSAQVMTYMAALLGGEKEVYDLHSRIKMSNDELRLGLFIVQHRDEYMGDSPVKYCKDLLIDTAGTEQMTKERICELLKYRGEKELLKQFSDWIIPKFPVTGYDLLGKDIPKGPVFAKSLNELKQVWKKSDFKLSKEELLEQLDDVVKKISS